MNIKPFSALMSFDNKKMLYPDSFHSKYIDGIIDGVGIVCPRIGTHNYELLKNQPWNKEKK